MFILCIVAFILVLGAFTFLSIPKGRKLTATAMFILLAGGTFALAFESAGQPKPVAMEWRDMTNLPVVGFAKNEEAKVIYFWVMRDGAPVNYVLPWPEDTEQLEDLWRARGQFEGLFLTGDDEEAKVRAEPNLPPKE